MKNYLSKEFFDATKQFLLKMKTTCLMIMVFASSLFATNVNSQVQKVDITAKNESIFNVIEKIEAQTDYLFVYNKNEIDLDRKVNIHVQGRSVTEVLSEIFNNSNVVYAMEGTNIMLMKKPVMQQQENTVTGTVTDASGLPLPGVTVVVQGTTRGTVTNADGNYSLTDVDDDAVLVFSFVGMKRQEIPVSGRSSIDVTMAVEAIGLEEVVAIGYGTVKKKDLTGSVSSVDAEDFRNRSVTQFTDMLSGTVAGFNANQNTSARGGASMEIRGPKSLSASTEPLIVLDGVIYDGSFLSINPNDIESVDILKDASAAAVYGSKAAAGVVLITTFKGKKGKPTINFSTKLGVSQVNNERRGLGPEEFVQFRQDYFRQVKSDLDFDFFTHPDNLPSGMTIDQWRNLSDAPLEDNVREWMARMNFFPEEQDNYLAGRTIDAFDYVFQKGLQQDYDVSISGGTESSNYYWSLGYTDNEGIIVGDEFSIIRSRLNADFDINDWLNVGVNTQFSHRSENSIPADADFWMYRISPYGRIYDEDGNLTRYPNGEYAENPLLDYKRVSALYSVNQLFSNLFANVKLPYGFNFKVSFQPTFQNMKNYSFTTISEALGGAPNEIPEGERVDYSFLNWQVDNLLTWKKEIGVHNFDLTLLANMEENQTWKSTQNNQNFLPNQELGYHGLQFGDVPGISNDDRRSTGDAYMARLNYTLMERYLITASVRRDGYSAFGQQNPRATFPAFAFAWVASEEDFFKSDVIDRLKFRVSWGANGNRDIGIYSALARVQSNLWYDGSSQRVGVYNATLANASLMWERTTSLNLGLDLTMLNNRINFSADVYDMTTTDLLMPRILPEVTGFSSIMANLGELGNKGVEFTLNTVNISNANFTWKSNLIFSANRNKIKALFGDIGTYTLLNEERTGEVPDLSNEWFPGQSLDVIWNYDVTGIWQTEEAEEAAEYDLEPGDYKAEDVDGDGTYVDIYDKQFIGHTSPRYRFGLRNDFNFLKNFTASVFVRADLGHLGHYVGSTGSWDVNDRANHIAGPQPYWTATDPNNEWPRLNANTSPFGGGLKIYKPRSFVRVQDLSLAYNLPFDVVQRMKLEHLRVFGSVRNLATFTNWPGWDPESGMDPMPMTFTIGLNFSL